MKLAFSSLILLLTGSFLGLAYHQDDYTLVYERMEVIRTDERYIKMKTHTFKYNRTQAMTNMTFEFKVDFGNDLKIRQVFQGYRFASNEYRLFPIVFERNACKSLRENENGNAFTCPMKKGNCTICNWFLDGPQLPPYIPSGHYMLEMKSYYRSIEIDVINLYGTVKRLFDRK